jgi:hypothetical protein
MRFIMSEVSKLRIVSYWECRLINYKYTNNITRTNPLSDFYYRFLSGSVTYQKCRMQNRGRTVNVSNSLVYTYLILF